MVVVGGQITVFIEPDEQRRRYASVDKRHMIAASQIRLRHRNAWPFPGCLQRVSQFAAASHSQEITTSANHIQLQFGHHLFWRVLRIFNVIGRAKQPQFFGVPRRKQDGAARHDPLFLPISGNFQENGRSRGIIIGPRPHHPG